MSLQWGYNGGTNDSSYLNVNQTSILLPNFIILFYFYCHTNDKCIYHNFANKCRAAAAAFCRWYIGRIFLCSLRYHRLSHVVVFCTRMKLVLLYLYCQSLLKSFSKIFAITCPGPLEYSPLGFVIFLKKLF